MGLCRSTGVKVKAVKVGGLKKILPSGPPPTTRVPPTVVGFKLSGHFKFFFDIINVR